MVSTNRVRAVLAFVAGMALFGVAAGPAAAQGTGAIRGTVIEADTRRPLGGVQITVPGTGRGALSNSAGEYLILNVPEGTHAVHAVMIGYDREERTVDVAAGETASLDFEVAQTAVSLDEIVVTGTAGEVSKRTIGNSITQINAEEVIEKVSNTTVTELLQGKAPSVTLLPGGGTVGTGGSIRIRGANSLVAGNDPVIYIDGVRIHSGAAGNFSNMWSASPGALGGQNAIALDQLNPEDIKSIEVIKGPAAATLYGADAAGGVIQIITKKGAPGQQELQWNARVQTGQVDWTVDPLRNYTTCTQARIDTPDEWPGCQGKSVGTLLDYSGLTQNPNGARAGTARNYQLSVRGGGDGYSFYIAGDRDYEEGVFRNNRMERTSGRANFAFYPAEGLDFSVNVGYTSSHTTFPLNDNDGRGLIISAAMYSPGREYPEDASRGFAWLSPEDAYKYDNQLWGERLTLGSTVNYRPLPWLKNRLTVGLDYNARLARRYGEPNSAFSTDGHLYERRPKDKIYTVDYVGTAEHQLTDDVASNLSFGAQYIRDYYHDTRSYGFGFGSTLSRMVNQAARTVGTDSHRETASLGLFVQEQIGWKDRLFVTGAVRMDNNSVFGAEIKRILYPKGMVSYVISDEQFFDVPGVDQLKLRGAWGQAGSAPAPFAAARTYRSSVATLQDGSSAPAVVLGAYGNPNLMPEKGEELELGLDASFLGNRAGLELTYYRQRMQDALMRVPVSPSSGFTGSRYENLGQTLNQGLEVALDATPVQTSSFAWDTRLSFYTNQNELVSFGYERDPILIGFYGRPQRHVEGYPLAGFWATVPERTADGAYAWDENGALVFEDTASYIGPSTPTREISFSNTFSVLGNLEIFALLDYKGGHYQYNYKDLSRCSSAVNDAGAFQPGRCWQVNNPDADEETRKIYGTAGGYYGRMHAFIQKADFVKLRDVSATYTLPTEWSRRVGADRAGLTVAAHDLAVWAPFYTGPDPEVNFYGDHEFWRADSWTAPMLRRITASLRVSF